MIYCKCARQYTNNYHKMSRYELIKGEVLAVCKRSAMAALRSMTAQDPSGTAAGKARPSNGGTVDCVCV